MIDGVSSMTLASHVSVASNTHILQIMKVILLRKPNKIFFSSVRDSGIATPGFEESS